MPLSLPRLQSRVPVTEGNGLPGRAFHQWWDRFAKSIEDAFNGLSVAVSDISDAQAAITALGALETVAAHEAKPDPHPQYLTAAEGSGAYAPLSHVGSGGAAHSNATTLVAGFMAATDKTKLDGVAVGATANATDASLRDRSTHTGTQSVSTLTGVLPLANGGTGATTLTGYVKGNGTSAMTASATVPASDVTGLAAVATSGSFSDLSNKPGIQSNYQNVITGSKTLGSADKGSNILILTSGITLTFPASGYAAGEGVVISNISGGNVTLSCPGGSDFGATLPNNGTFFAFCDGGGFWRQYCYSTSRL